MECFLKTTVVTCLQRYDVLKNGLVACKLQNGSYCERAPCCCVPAPLFLSCSVTHVFPASPNQSVGSPIEWTCYSCTWILGTWVLDTFELGCILLGYLVLGYLSNCVLGYMLCSSSMCSLISFNHSVGPHHPVLLKWITFRIHICQISLGYTFIDVVNSKLIYHCIWIESSHAEVT